LKFIQEALGTVRLNNDTVRKLREQHQTATLNEQETKISRELNRILNENNAIFKRVKDQMEELNTDVQASQAKYPNEPETRIKATSYQALSAKFQDVLKESQAVQSEFKSSAKGKMERQVKMIDETLTDEQVEEICNDPEGAAKLMAQKIHGQGHTKLQNAVADIQDKYKDILKLEASVKLVHQMFMDMAILVSAQGEMLNNIELNVKESKDYMLKSVKRLDDAKQDHISARKKQCMIAACLIVIAIILIVVFVL
jgi:syntaxin 1B/2/3